MLVESHLLLSAPADLLSLIMTGFVYIEDSSLAPEELISRKWARSHLGKPSYKDRGVTMEEYRVYLEG